MDLKKSLTILPRLDKRDDREDVQILAYAEAGEMLGIPRSHPTVGHWVPSDAELKVSDGRPIACKYQGEYILDQREALDTFLDKFRSVGYGGGIFQAPGGTGKTYWGAQLIGAMGRTAAILVHRSFLVDQWLNTLTECLPGVKVGIVRQDRCEYEDVDVSIIFVQSAASRNRQYPADLFSSFGLLLVDEVHLYSAETYSQVGPRFTARYRAGLTATPRRKDRAEKLFFWNIGPVIYRSTAKRMTAKVKRIFTEVVPVIPGYEHREPDDIPEHKLMDWLINHEYRNRVIRDELKLAVGHGRKVLAFSGRREHLDRMNKEFKKELPDVETDFYVGGRSSKQLEKASRAQLVWATTQMAGTGLNIPSVDCQFLMTPVGDVEQIYYRCTRYEDEKRQPVIVEFIDDQVPLYKKLWKYRLQFYRKAGALQ